MVNKQQIACDDARKFGQPLESPLMQDNANFHPLLEPLQIQNSTDRLVIGTISLDDMVVD